jgi:hypothetical protein
VPCDRSEGKGGGRDGMYRQATQGRQWRKVVLSWDEKGGISTCSTSALPISYVIRCG